MGAQLSLGFREVFKDLGLGGKSFYGVAECFSETWALYHVCDEVLNKSRCSILCFIWFLWGSTWLVFCLSGVSTVCCLRCFMALACGPIRLTDSLYDS